MDILTEVWRKRKLSRDRIMINNFLENFLFGIINKHSLNFIGYRYSIIDLLKKDVQIFIKKNNLEFKLESVNVHETNIQFNFKDNFYKKKLELILDF
jgi:hypothetical protein